MLLAHPPPTQSFRDPFISTQTPCSNQALVKTWSTPGREDTSELRHSEAYVHDEPPLIFRVSSYKNAFAEF